MCHKKVKSKDAIFPLTKYNLRANRCGGCGRSSFHSARDVFPSAVCLTLIRVECSQKHRARYDIIRPLVAAGPHTLTRTNLPAFAHSLITWECSERATNILITQLAYGRPREWKETQSVRVAHSKPFLLIVRWAALKVTDECICGCKELPAMTSPYHQHTHSHYIPRSAPDPHPRSWIGPLFAPHAISLTCNTRWPSFGCCQHWAKRNMWNLYKYEFSRLKTNNKENY